jgi:hypothetical protein
MGVEYFLLFEGVLAVVFIASVVSQLILEWRIKYGKTITKGGIGFTAKITMTRDWQSMGFLNFIMLGVITFFTLMVYSVDHTQSSKLLFTILNSIIIIYLFYYSSPFKKNFFKELKRIRKD